MTITDEELATKIASIEDAILTVDETTEFVKEELKLIWTKLKEMDI